MRRLPEDRYERNDEQARKTARIQAEFIIQQIEHLRKVDRNKRMETATRSFLALLEIGEDLTPPQYSYLDGIYETTMGAAGLPSCRVHSDRKPKALKFG